jgi:formylglycine-generating enzyme required for sulfatase activity
MLIRTPKIETTDYAIKGIKIPVILVEGGSFMMGSEEYDREKPIHQVHVDSFLIGQYPITQELYLAVMEENPSYLKGNLQNPVEEVSWDDAQSFIEKLNSLTGEKFRLPTEAEWEYAARGGKEYHTDGYQYAGGNDIHTVGWYNENSARESKPVGLKQPNQLGIYDMSGNVREWCQDWYEAYPSTPQTNPQGPENGSNRVYRGGSWNNYAHSTRVSNRDNRSPGNRRNDLGFRLSKTVTN